MVSQEKLQTVKEVSEQLKDYNVIGILDMHKLPGKQLFDIRNKLRSDATIRMVKKRLIKFIFKDVGKKDLDKLVEHIQGEPALLLSKKNPFKLAKTIMNSKSKAKARPGDIAPEDIVIKAGPTSLPPGPAIGDLQRLKIPAMVQGDKIHVRQDTTIVKEGEEISAPIADILTKLEIEPMEIGLNLVAVWDNGTIYDNAVLFVPAEKYLEDLKQAHTKAFNLAYNIDYYTSDNIPLFLSKAHDQAVALAKEANIVTKDTVGEILGKAKAQAEELKKHVKEEPKQEEKLEETPVEEKAAEASKQEEALTEEKSAEEPKEESSKEGDESPSEEKKEEKS